MNVEPCRRLRLAESLTAFLCLSLLLYGITAILPDGVVLCKGFFGIIFLDGVGNLDIIVGMVEHSQFSKDCSCGNHLECTYIRKYGYIFTCGKCGKVYRGGFWIRGWYMEAVKKYEEALKIAGKLEDKSVKVAIISKIQALYHDFFNTI